ncbi:MAG: hypothetical protein ABL907_26010 [Hyphomicrobium sp.]
MADENSRARKLPVFATAYESLRLTTTNIGTVVRLSWLWLAAFVLATCALYWMLYPVSVAAGANSAIMEAVNLTTYVVSGLAGSGIAVPWHRVLLLGETGEAARREATAPRILRYFTFGFLLILPMSLIGIMSTFIPAVVEAKTDTGFAWTDVPWPLVAVAYITLLLAYVRLGLKLPAIALGRDDLAVADVWTKTRGNTWRLFVVVMLVSLPCFAALVLLIAVIEPALLIDPANLDRWAYTRSNASLEVLSLTLGIFAITALSLSFRHFFAAEQVRKNSQPPDENETLSS